ncbi:Amino acid permease [Saxophila tyrrhenica]|uniref:Amino acid permease n=1 Tax=Saxophila tyrrhenica TaxID=1690608 RepID=A0AAV9PM99_9PEZI|nr:Amino acid permease [Saxophila tyrrhenica]
MSESVGPYEAKDSHSVSGPEKGFNNVVAGEGDVITVKNAERPDLMTRMGLTKESFERRTLADKHNQLNKTLKTRHLNMIAIGGSIGAGLFVGSGSALSTGGPGALLLDFGIVGVMIFMVVYALGELAIQYPVSGGFYTYSVRFIDPSWGFAMGYNYVFQWAIVVPLELTVAGFTVGYWQVDVSVGVWITIFFLAIVFINIFGVLGYAEEEFWVSALKLITIVIFLIMGVIFVCGGGPSNGDYSEYWGARLWYDPGALAQGFYGICAVFVTAAFSFSGTELVGLAAAESETPQASLPSAIKQVFWRITLFYILALLFVGLLVPYTDDRLLGAGYIDVTASPFVIVAEKAGIPAFGSFVNVVILCSVLSIGMSGVYGGSRTLTALAEQGYAPKIFGYIDRAGRPLVSVSLILAFGPIAYIGLASSGAVVFDWLLALSGLAALFTWGSICLAHIRFRAAWKYHGHSLDELTWKSPFGVWGSWLGLLIIFLVLAAQFYTAVKPMEAEAFFKSYLALFVVLLFYAIGYAWKREGWRKLSEIDVDSGRRVLNFEEYEKLKARKAGWPMWKRVLDYLF